MSILNEKTEETSKKIHLMVTNLCSRHCPNCCNKCYSLDDIPLVTEDELKNCETLFLTGGEPFEFCNVDALAKYYKEHYPNIENVIVYGNIKEFAGYLFLEDNELVIKTLEDGKSGKAKHIATVKDFIIKGVQGEFYFCKPDIFYQTYEFVCTSRIEIC